MSKILEKRFFHLITKEDVFGEIQVLENNPEILIVEPYTVKNGNMMPYMYNILGISPKAIQIHPMNILWSVPLDEFEELDKQYTKVRTGIILN